MTHYELYHDESMENGYWHGMLLVPVEKKSDFVELLKQTRKNTNYYEPISIKRVKEHNRVFECAQAWIALGFGLLRSRSKGQPYPVTLGRNKGKLVFYDFPASMIGAKFILFRERDNHQQMQYYSDHASKIETTFRFAIKGGTHFLGSDESPIFIEKMHFDGYKHHHRHLDRTRIVDRLNGLRNYVQISSRTDLIEDGTSDHREAEAQSYEDCQLLQLTDLLIGSYRSALGIITRPIHKELARLPKELIYDYQKGFVRMRNSRWFNSFWLSECYLERGKWFFDTLEIESEQENGQLSFL